jgi:hypothetical protein
MGPKEEEENQDIIVASCWIFVYIFIPICLPAKKKKGVNRLRSPCVPDFKSEANQN